MKGSKAQKPVKEATLLGILVHFGPDSHGRPQLQQDREAVRAH